MPNPLVDQSWPVLRHLIGGHTAVYRATRGLVGHHVPGAPPMLLLDHVGAKSGKVRTTPLAYLRDGENVVLVASKGGAPEHPAWYLNMQAQDEVGVQIKGDRFKARPRDAEGEERERLWNALTEVWPDYDEYQKKTDREIPIVVLERV